MTLLGKEPADHHLCVIQASTAVKEVFPGPFSRRSIGMEHPVLAGENLRPLTRFGGQFFALQASRCRPLASRA